jgi:ribosome-associated protein
MIEAIDDKRLYDGPSRSQVKREAHAVTDLAKRLIALNPKKLATIPLDEHVIQHILAAQTMQRGALKRQGQYIGKLMRSIELEPIEKALQRLDQPDVEMIQHLHQLEQWREQLIAGNQTTFDTLVTHFPTLDRQHLNQLLRQARKEQTENKTPTASRAVFQYLKTLSTDDEAL